MATTHSKRDIVIFLGAGFSCDAGLPIMDEFGGDSDYHFGALQRERQNRLAGKLLCGAGNTFKALQRDCRKAEGRVGVNPENMEDVFSIAEVMSQAEMKPFFTVRPQGGREATESEDFPASVLDEIKLWLWEVYRALPPLDPRRLEEKRKKGISVRPEAYECFVKDMAARDLHKRLTVVTTNYDIVLEYYWWALTDTPCDYPLAEGWDYHCIHAGPATMPPYLNTSMRHPPKDPADVCRVCKLHGSVNFFELEASAEPRFGICDDVAVASQTVGASPIPAYTPGHTSAIPESKRNQRPAVLAEDAIWSLHEKYGQSLTPAIVPPTYAKLTGRPWLRRMWNAALNAISEARLLLLIGYSLPQTDGFMRAMFQGALSRRTDDGPEVYAIDPAFENDREGKNETRERYMTLFPGLQKDSKRLIPSSFAQASQNKTIERILSSV